MAAAGAADTDGAAPGVAAVAEGHGRGLPLARPRAAALLFALAVCCLLPRTCEAAPSDAGELYCGKENCYQLLGLTREASAADVKKAFRKLALQWHPDKNKSPSAASKFRSIGRANEVLSDDKLRRAYDYFLDHPEDRYTHYYQYYHAAYAPQTPIWAVVLGVLTFLSSLQYINQQWRYGSMMRAIKYQPQFKRRVNELIEAEVAALKGKVSKAEREVLKDRMEIQVLESEVEVAGGGFSKPSLTSLILVRSALLPVTITSAIYGAAMWTWRFRVKGEEYGEEERFYLTCKALGLSGDRFLSMDEPKRKEMLDRELWVPDNLMAFHAEQQEEMQQKMARSGAYKRAKRWMRNHG